MNKSQRWEYLRLMLSEWVTQTDWQRIHWKRKLEKQRWGDCASKDLSCMLETFGLYPIGMGLSKSCCDEIRRVQDG